MSDKNRVSLPVRFFALFVAAQFLNVQIQTAFATEAIVAQQRPEMAQALSQLKERLTTRLDKMSEDAQYRYAYRLFKVGLKIRNRAYSKSDGEVQEHIDLLNHPEKIQATVKTEETSEEDREVVAMVQSEQDLFQDASPSGSTLKTEPRLENKIELDAKSIKKEKLIANADSVLLSLGATAREDGHLRGVSYKIFQSRAATFDQSSASRAPASVGGVILRVILSLLVIAVGLAVIFFMLILVALGGLSGTAVMTPAWFYVITAGIIGGVFFAVRAIILAQNPGQNSTFKQITA